MNSLLQLLGVAFWMRPLQRALVVLAVVAALAAFVIPPGDGRIAPLLLLGMWLMLVAPLLAGGVYLRMLSAQRCIALLPHARGRLLAGAIGVVLLSALLVALTFWIGQRPTPPQYRPGIELYAMLFVQTFAFGTQLAIALFIASRSPRWGLVALVALYLPGLAMRWFDTDDLPRLLSGPIGLALAAACWLPFGIWYLRARFISPTGWRGGDAAAAGGTGSRALEQPAGTREQAMQRWLLGAMSPMRASLTWLAGAAVLVGSQLILGRDSPPQTVTAMIFGTFGLSAVAMFAIAHTIAVRSRGLWLTGARDRAALHAWCEALLLRYLVHVALPFAFVGLILWQLLPARPQLPGAYLLVMTMAFGSAMAWLGLAQLRQRLWMDLAVGVSAASLWCWGLLLPLFSPAPVPRWGLLGLLVALAIAARQLAVRRWRRADWPRARQMEPAG